MLPLLLSACSNQPLLTEPRALATHSYTYGSMADSYCPLYLRRPSGETCTRQLGAVTQRSPHVTQLLGPSPRAHTSQGLLHSWDAARCLCLLSQSPPLWAAPLTLGTRY